MMRPPVGVTSAAALIALTTVGLWVASAGGVLKVSAQEPVAPRRVPASAQDAEPVDLTGTWVSVVSEDWRWRMVTPPKGDRAGVPLNAAGVKATEAWDYQKDQAEGLQCKAYGIGNIVRQPGRVRISWQDANLLRFEFDAGEQTRLLYFDPSKMPSGELTLQGVTRAVWEGPGVGRNARGRGEAGEGARLPGGGGAGLRGGPPPKGAELLNIGGTLKLVTTRFRAGYLRKNGLPYSERATITEYVHRLPQLPNGDDLLHITTVVEDPEFLTEPFQFSTHFKREPDGSKWHPTPCRTDPPPTPDPAAKMRR